MLQRHVSFSFLNSGIIILLLFPLAVSAQMTGRLTDNPDVEKWITTSFKKGKIPPFSFKYNGKPSSEFIRKWNYSVKKEASNDPLVIKYLYLYTDKNTQLQVRCHVTGYKDFHAVEWVMDFVNTSNQNSGALQNINVADYTVAYTNEGTSTLHYALGSNAKRSDFRPISTTIEKEKGIYLTPEGGRSSNTTGFPFFNIETPDKRGMVVAIGWTGNWFADISQKGTKGLSLASGMKNLNLFLYPNESIRTPGICFLFWQGNDRMIGNNTFRRFLLAHHSRMINGQFAELPMSAGFQGTAPPPCNENSCLTEDYALAIVHRHKQFNIVPEVFWLDAGWYKGSGGPNYEGKDWYNQVGNWIVDSARFPHGLKPLSDAVHQVGSKFMLWYEPERVRPGSKFALEHPEWMMKLPNNDNYLFDLGNKEARQWLTAYISKSISDNGVDYYRQDFNMDPAPYWAAHDEAGRLGIKEIRHIEGLYAFWDSLVAKFPNMLIDNCASGGRRLDLETTSRSAPLWRTDYQYGEPNGAQNHTYGLSFWLPLNGTGCGVDTFSFRSDISSAMVMNWSISATQVSLPQMQRTLRKYKELQPYFYEDYYALTGVGDLTGDDVWLAYQFNKPSDSTGIVVGFRRKDAKKSSTIVKLSGLNKRLTYEIFNDNDGTTITKRGTDLENGLMLQLSNAPSSLLLQYKAKSQQ